jgi:hypothetical protein
MMDVIKFVTKYALLMATLTSQVGGVERRQRSLTTNKRNGYLSQIIQLKTI